MDGWLEGYMICALEDVRGALIVSSIPSSHWRIWKAGETGMEKGPGAGATHGAIVLSCSDHEG